MGKKINNATEFPATTPAATDRVLGIDVSNVSNDANGEVVTFTVADIIASAGAVVTEGNNISLLTNDAGYLTAVNNDNWSGLDLSIANGGTGASTAAAARSALGLAIGTDVLAYDINLQSFVTAFTLPTVDGTVDQVLKTDGAGNIGFATAGGGGGLIPISKTTAAASAAVDIALTGGYSAYAIRVEHMRTSNDTQIVLRFSVDGGTTFVSTSNYVYGYTTLGLGGSGTDTQGYLGAAGSAAGESANGWIYLYPADGTSHNISGFTMFLINSAGGSADRTGTIRLNTTTTAMTDARIFVTLGNITTGDFHLYGIAEGA